MKYTCNRLLAGALAVMLTFALWPAVALADGTTRDVGSAAEFASALSASQSGDTIRLTADITHTSEINISGKNLIFDVDGHTLLLNVYVSGGRSALSVSSGSVSLADTGGAGAFNVKATGGDGNAVYAGAGGTVTVTSVNGTSQGAYAYGGAITVMGDATGDDNGVYAAGGGSITVHGNALTTGRHYGAFASGGTVTVDGNVTATSTSAEGGVYAEGGTVTVKGNVSVMSSVYSFGATSRSNGNVTIDGTITAREDRYILIDGYSKGQEAGATGAGADAGYLVYTQSGYGARVRVKIPLPTVCEIGSTGYTSLAAALAAVQSGQTIKLLDDIDYADGITVDGKSLIFDLNSHTLNVTATSENALTVQNGGSVALTGTGEFNVAATGQQAYGVAAIGEGSSAQVTNASAVGQISYGAYAMDGGTVTAQNVSASGESCIGATAINGTVTVAGNVVSDGVGSGGVMAGNGGTIQVGGNVSASGASSIGVQALDAGTVEVAGNVTDIGSSGFGIIAQRTGATVRVTGSVIVQGPFGRGVRVDSGTEVTIDGGLMGDTYINLDGEIKTPADMQTDVAKPGYAKYTDGTNTVWVKLPTYEVTMQDDGHGTGSADHVTAWPGQTVTLSATPANGYLFKEWQTITPADLSIAGGVFTMPNEVVTVKAVFEPIICQIGATPYTSLASALAGVQNGQTIQLLQDISHTSGVTIENKTVTFAPNGHTLDISVSSGNALTVQNGGKVLVTGSGALNVKTTGDSAYGVSVSGSGSSAVVTNARAEGEGSSGAHAMTGGSVTVLGNATSSGSDSYGAYAEGAGAAIIVQGNAEATGVSAIGAYASGAGSLTVNGNIKAIGEIGYGVVAFDRGTVTVHGDVTATTGTSSVGAYADHNSTVTIDGSITASKYILVGDVQKTKQEKKTGTTKSGYDTYTDNTNTVWVKKTVCAVTFSNDSATYDTVTAVPGAPVASADWPANPEKTGYNFGGWFTGAGGTGTQLTASTAVSDDITVYAKWTIKIYMVAFDCQGGGAINMDAVPHDGLLNRPVDPRWDGHSFEGWYKEATCKNAWNFATDRVTDFIVVYAKWSLVRYSIHYDLGGGAVSPANPESYTVEVGAITLRNPTRPGYGFAGWTGTDISGKSASVTIAAGSVGDRTYTANWVVNAHTVTFHSDGAVYATRTANAGAGIGSANWPSDPAKTGYTFDGWFTDANGTGTRFTADTAANADLTLYALWSVNTYTAAFDSQGGSAVPGILVNFGATIVPPVEPIRMNYTFEGWFRDAACTSSWNFDTDTVAGDTVLYARWVAQTPAATLSGISLSAGALTSAFKPTATSYTVNLGENDASVTVTPDKTYDGAMLTIDGKKIATQRVTLANGKSATMTIKVTLGRTSKTYKLTIKRPKSTSNTLASIQVSAGTLSPTFDPATTTYTLVLPQGVAKTTINAARSSSLASVTSAKATYTLKNGQTVKATVKVRSQSGATRTYTITILRAKSDNANLASLKTTSRQSPLSPTFRAETTDYTVTLPAKTSSITLSWKVADSLSRVTINGKAGTSAKIELKNGQSTTVTVLVTAQAGNTKKYTVVVTRP